MTPNPTYSFTSTVEKLFSTLWNIGFRVPQKVVNNFEEKGPKRVLCDVNGTIQFQCAMMPDGENGYFIMLNKKLRTDLGLEIGDKIEVTIQKDDSEYGLPMPEELREVLEIDDEASTYFHALTAGKQRTLLHWVGTVKTPDSRIRRSLAIADHLKEYKGKLDYRTLFDYFKSKNSM